MLYFIYMGFVQLRWTGSKRLWEIRNTSKRKGLPKWRQIDGRTPIRKLDLLSAKGRDAQLKCGSLKRSWTVWTKTSLNKKGGGSTSEHSMSMIRGTYLICSPMANISYVSETLRERSLTTASMSQYHHPQGDALILSHQLFVHIYDAYLIHQAYLPQIVNKVGYIMDPINALGVVVLKLFPRKIRQHFKHLRQRWHALWMRLFHV